MLEKIDENFIKRLRLIARGIARGNCDSDELVNESVEYLLKSKDKYKNHPNPIALAVLKMKGLHIDFIRKNKNLTAKKPWSSRFPRDLFSIKKHCSAFVDFLYSHYHFIANFLKLSCFSEFLYSFVDFIYACRV